MSNKKIISVFMGVVILSCTACSSSWVKEDERNSRRREMIAETDSLGVTVATEQDKVSVPMVTLGDIDSDLQDQNTLETHLVSARDYSEGVAWIRRNTITDSWDSSYRFSFWSCIDVEGKTVFSIEEDMIPVTGFSNGIAVIATDQDLYTFGSYKNPSIIDKTGSILWSLDKDGKTEGERFFGVDAVENIELYVEMNEFIDLGYIFILFHINTFEYSGVKLGVLDSNLDWYLDPTNELCDLTSLHSLSFVGSGIYEAKVSIGSGEDFLYDSLTNEFVGRTNVDRETVSGWVEQNRLKIENDSLTFINEKDAQDGLVGFYNEKGELVIDLSSYNITGSPFFINGYCVLDIKNEQGAGYTVVINKAGEQMAAPIKQGAHGNIVNGLFWMRNSDGSGFSYLDENMKVVIPDIDESLPEQMNDFTEEGIARISVPTSKVDTSKDDYHYYIRKTGERIEIEPYYVKAKTE